MEEWKKRFDRNVEVSILCLKKMEEYMDAVLEWQTKSMDQRMSQVKRNLVIKIITNIFIPNWNYVDKWWKEERRKIIEYYKNRGIE